jgi:hypothetical protein
MKPDLLPADFAELDPFVSDWALPTEPERSLKRRTSNMTQIQAFYQAIMSRMEKIIEHLNGFPLESLPEPERRLLYLALSVMEISFAVEVFGEPEESGMFDATRLSSLEV